MFKNLYRKAIRKFKRLFRRNQERTGPSKKPVIQPPSNPTRDTGPIIHGILVFDGHYEESYGTRTYNKIKEMFSNRMNNAELKKKWDKHQISNSVVMRLEHRDKSNYTSHCRDSRKKVKQFAKDIGCKPENILVLETHYNAADVESARGGYIIVEKGEVRSVIAAKAIIDHIIENTPITYRREYMGHKGIKGMSEGRGFGWVDYCNDDGAMSLLIEYLFVDFLNEESEWLFGKKDMTHDERNKQMRIVADKISNLMLDALIKAVKEFNGNPS